MRTFYYFCKTRKTAVLAQCFELLITSGKHFVRIALVTNIPHDCVARTVKYAVQGYGKLNNTEVTRQMTAVSADNVYDFGSYFGSKFC